MLLGMAERIGIAILFVLVLELCARTEDWLRWGAPFGAAYSPDTLTVSDAFGRHNRPGARYEKWHINSHGFRGPEIPLKKPDGIIRIVVTGASEAFGLYESPGMEFPAQMQRELNAVCPGVYQVLNAASAGMTPPNITHYFKTWLLQFEPDILICYPAPAFYLDIEPPRLSVTAQTGQTGTRHAFRSSWRLTRKVRISLKRLLPDSLQAHVNRFRVQRIVSDHPPGWVWETPPLGRLRLFRRHMDQMIGVVQKHETTVILGTHAVRFAGGMSTADKRFMASWRRFYPRASQDCLLAAESACNAIIRELASARGIAVVDIDSLVQKSPCYFADSSHFTDEGAAVVSTAFVSQILRRVPAAHRQHGH